MQYRAPPRRYGGERRFGLTRSIAMSDGACLRSRTRDRRAKSTAWSMRGAFLQPGLSLGSTGLPVPLPGVSPSSTPHGAAILDSRKRIRPQPTLAFPTGYVLTPCAALPFAWGAACRVRLGPLDVESGSLILQYNCRVGNNRSEGCYFVSTLRARSHSGRLTLVTLPSLFDARTFLH